MKRNDLTQAYDRSGSKPMETQRGAAVRIRRLLGGLTASALIAGGLVTAAAPANAAVVITPTSTSISVLGGASYQSLNIGASAVSGFGGSDVVLTTITTSAGKVKISTVAGLSAVTGYPSGDWTAGASQIAFTGSQTNVNAALASLTYQNASLATSTVTISTVLGAGTEGGINYSTISYLPDTGRFYLPDTRAGVSWESAFCLSRYNFYASGNATPISNNAGFDYSNGSCSAKAGYSRQNRTFNGLIGYLATSTSATENQFIYDKVGQAAWIAGSDRVTEGNWQWMSGPEQGTTFWTSACGQGLKSTCTSTGQYNYWNSGEPNDSGGNEDAILFVTSPAATWNDANTGNNQFYIVEFGGAPDSSTPAPSPSLSGTSTLSVTTVAAPTITTVTPASGGTSGNSAVTITGTNFTNASAVTFGGVAASNYTVNSSTQIVAYTPTGSAGTVNVAVTTPGGGTATKTSAYTYVAPPTISGVSPSAGPTAGGTSITITGTGFTGATSVTVGGVAASFSVVSSTSIQAQTPARPVGSAAVSVTTGGGTATSGLSAFEYLAAPVISTVLPNRGPTTGNTSVTITGSGFTGTTGVTFGGVPGSSVTVVSDTQVTVNSPSGSSGTVTVALTAPGGTASMPSAFTYQAAPVITAITPSTSAEAGGQSVVLTGSNFTGATAVTFGGTAALSFSVNSDTQITAEVPPKGSMASTVDVAVTATGGTGTKSGAFTYVAGPSVASVSPTSGPTTGGTSVTITGTGMGNATSVEFDGVLGTIVSNTSTRIVVTTPATVAGAATVSVTNAFGTSGLNDAFTFQSQPTVTSVSPNSGPTAGGTSVTITGTDFTGATAVRFGSTNATSFTVNSATSITAVTPVKAAGAVAVDVVTPGGTGTLAGGFTYRAAPTVTSVSPAAGVPGGGTSVTITGTGLASASAVTFGGVAATIVTTSDTSITATTPAGTGAVTVAVTTTGGSGSKASAYTYASAPTITGVSPASGPIAGGTSITLTGTNFTNASVVTIGGTAATSYSVVSATSITAVVPASTAGQKNIVVTTPGGTVTSVNAYQYFSTPTLTGVSPTSGLLTGGTSVTLTGTNFTGATAVTFGGTAAVSFTVNSATSITAVTPARTAGVVTVAVTTPGGVASQSAAFTYAEAPTITTVNPASGSLAGGQTITLTGANLTGATGVTVGGVAATSVTVVNSTTVTAVTPIGSAGAKTVTVSTPGGDGTLPSGFIYVSAPTVSTVSPNLGGLVGGTTVTITGTNLAGATGVTFGGVAAAFSPVNATTITATTPASGASGAVDVVVTTTGGTATKINGFTYAGLPTIVALTPTGGNVAGGTAVVITGTNFTGATSVIFGDTTATFSVINAGEISATSPARTAGTVKVEVVTASGTASKADAFTYYGTPTVTSVTAATGPITGGTTVTITGTNFTGATGVTFGGTAATGVTVVSSRELTVVTPVKPAGPVTVAVTTPGGTGSKTAAFTYVSGPTVTSVTASSGPLDGGNEVTIAGSGFTGATAVTFGGVSATTFTVNSDVQIVATVPAGAAGSVAIAVTATGGTGTLPSGYAYVAAPTISSLSPAAGTTAGGTTVTITGTGLTGASAVTFGGAAGTTIKVITANQITVVTPAGSAGVVDVALTAAGGTVSLVSGFTYVAPSTGGTSTSTSTTTTTTTSVAPNPIPPGSSAALPAAPGPDGSVLLVDGQSRPVTVTRNSSTRTAEVVGTGFTMNMYGTSSGGTPLGFNTNGAMLIEANRLVKVAGTGFQPNSKVSIFIFSTARTLGTLTTNAQGAFDGSVGVPLDVLPGEHTVQVNGYTTSSQVRSLSLGVELKATGTTAKRIVSFKGKSAKLTKVAKRRLAAFANQMSGRPTILVAGSAGQGRNNDTKLARQRVNVVTKYLRGLGVNGNYTTKPYSGDIVSGGQSGRKVTVTANW